MKKYLFLTLVLLLALVFSLTACGGNNEPEPTAAAPAGQGDAARGQQLFASACAACHGPQGEGVPGLGKDMTQSEFIAGQTNEELVAFVKTGRPASHPLNTTGIDMPPKGGNPALTDADIYDIVAYVYSIQK